MRTKTTKTTQRLAQPDAWTALCLKTMTVDALRKELATSELSADERRWMLDELTRKAAR